MRLKPFRMTAGRSAGVIVVLGIALALAKSSWLWAGVGTGLGLWYFRAFGEFEAAREEGGRVGLRLGLVLVLKAAAMLAALIVTTAFLLLVTLALLLAIAWTVYLIGGELCIKLLGFELPREYPTSVWVVARAIAGVFVLAILLMPWSVVLIMAVSTIVVDWGGYLLDPREERRLLRAIPSPAVLLPPDDPVGPSIGGG